MFYSFVCFNEHEIYVDQWFSFVIINIFMIADWWVKEGVDDKGERRKGWGDVKAEDG